MSNPSLEQLVVLRDALLNTISNLEMGLRAEKKKADEYEFFRNNKDFNQTAMDEQAARSLDNVKSIKKILDEEKNKLKTVDEEIKNATKIINTHGTHPCLIGAVPHSWKILARHPSGQFQHRECSICGTSEKVGYA